MAQQSLITLVMYQETVSCTLFLYTKNSVWKEASGNFVLHQGEIIQGYIFNPTNIACILRLFLQKNSARATSVAIALAGTAIQEHIMHVAADQQPDFSCVPQHHIWNSLSWHHNHKKYIYTFSTSRELLMQYQLLAITTPFFCCLMSSITRCLLESVPAHDLVPEHLHNISAYQHYLATCVNIQNDFLSIVHRSLFDLARKTHES